MDLIHRFDLYNKRLAMENKYAQDDRNRVLL